VTRPSAIAVIVPSAGRDEHLRRLLAGLAAQRRPPDDVVVADMDDARNVLAGAPLAVRRHVVAGGDGPLPVARARNASAATSDADVLVFLDVDCLPHRDLVADYADALAGAPPVLACGRVRYLRAGWDDRWPLDEQSDPLPTRPAVVAPSVDHGRPDLFWSLNFAVTAATWQTLGGFDEGYTGYGAEDTDLGRRAHLAGIPLLWLPGGLAYHQWHPPTWRDPTRTAEIVANARRFRERWGSWPMSGWLTDLAEDGVVRFDPDADVLEVDR
jgi:GT2 family glycosyltransferase